MFVFFYFFYGLSVFSSALSPPRISDTENSPPEPSTPIVTLLSAISTTFYIILPPIEAPELGVEQSSRGQHVIFEVLTETAHGIPLASLQ